MSIASKDFIPRDTTTLLSLSRSCEPMDSVVARANAWMAAEDIEPLNVETLLRPGTPGKVEQVQSYVEYTTMGISVAQWHHVLRVWYRAD